MREIDDTFSLQGKNSLPVWPRYPGIVIEAWSGREGFVATPLELFARVDATDKWPGLPGTATGSRQLIYVKLRTKVRFDRLMSPQQGYLQRFFDFYAVYFGVTAPPPAKQKLFLILLIAFFIFLGVGLVVFAKIVGGL